MNVCKLAQDVINEECDRVLSWTEACSPYRLTTNVEYTMGLCETLQALYYKAYPSTSMQCQVIDLTATYHPETKDAAYVLRACLGSKTVSCTAVLWLNWLICTLSAALGMLERDDFVLAGAQRACQFMATCGAGHAGAACVLQWPHQPCGGCAAACSHSQQ